MLYTGYNNRENGRILKRLFDRPYFRIKLLPDAVSVAVIIGTGVDSGILCEFSVDWVRVRV